MTDSKFQHQVPCFTHTVEKITVSKREHKLKKKLGLDPPQNSRRQNGELNFQSREPKKSVLQSHLTAGFCEPLTVGMDVM
jgi:hypothetical protein